METLPESNFEEVLQRIPPRQDEPLPPTWLRSEMEERYKVLEWAGIQSNEKVIEVGSGAHAIATVPLAFMVGDKGRVVAVEKERWRYFHQVISDSGLKPRVDGLGCDASRLPVHSKTFDTAAVVHGIRSLRNEKTVKTILAEMMRVATQVFVAESLPIARTKAQEAHLEMYNLREEIFEAVLGEKDDIHYFDFDTLKGIVESAGGRIGQSGVVEVDLPHYLGFIPKEYVEKIQDTTKKADLLKRWEHANKMVQEYGEEHPPVGVILAESP